MDIFKYVTIPLILAVIAFFFKFFIGDRKARSEHRQKTKEIQNLSFDLLSFVLSSFKMNKDFTKVISDNPEVYKSRGSIPKLIETTIFF